MRTYRVVFIHPALRIFSCWVQVHEQPSVEDFATVGTVESFNKGALGGFARQSELELDALALTPVPEHGASKLWAMVELDALRFVSHHDDPSSARRTRSAVSDKFTSMHRASRL